ncbi:glycosyltransferase family 87 protein [Microlunatus panaciterrae]
MIGRLADRYDRHRGGRAVIGWWVVTRLIIIALMSTIESFVVGDVFYYWRKTAALWEVGLPSTLNEYPTPVAWILWLPYGLSAGHRVGYLVAFIALMMVLDGAFCYLLWRMNGRRHDRAIDFWLVFVLLVGPLAYLRFDLLPAVLAGGALLYARRHPWVTGAFTGLGAAIKLWPALLMPAFLAHRPGRKDASATFVGVGFGLALLSLLLGGWGRLVSPLTWQSGRGLQIESVWATPLMILRAIRPHAWVVDISRFQAYEIFGSGVGSMLLLSNLATVVGFVVMIALFARGFRTDPSPIAVGLVILSVVAIMVVTNKTLSPQYLLWLGGPMAALLAMKAELAEDERALIRRLGKQLVLLALLTHLVYPSLYDGLLGRQGHVMIIISTVAVTLRNLALVLFTVEVCRLAWRFLGPEQQKGRHGSVAALR